MIVVGTNIMDIDNFMFSLTMRVPTNHPMLTCRVVFYGVQGFGAIRELYNNASLAKSPIGPFQFFYIVNLLREQMLITKVMMPIHFTEVVPWQTRIVFYLICITWCYLASIAYCNG